MSETAAKVRLIRISAEQAGQRIDNFLMAQLKSVPRSLVYRLLRSGQVRVNSGRKKPHYRLQADDEVRIPPVSTRQRSEPQIPAALQQQLRDSILLENDDVLILNKPSGVPVHAGSGYRYGVIEGLRVARPDATLELVHRLDRETSGCLLLAKNRASLTACNAAFRVAHAVNKQYLALVQGHWPGSETVDLAIDRALRSGERMMQTSDSGQPALSHFECQTRYDKPVAASLMRVRIDTGRTHQIRVHARARGHALAADSKYGDRDFNAAMKAVGLKRLFLHAEKLEFSLPGLDKVSVTAALPDELQQVLDQLT